MSRYYALLECYCGYTRWVSGRILYACPKCGRAGNKQEVIDERDYEKAALKATALMMEEGQLDKYKG